MKRSELEHLIRAAGTIADDAEIVIIGSQAILGQFPDAPSVLLVSAEADLYPLNHPELADLIDGRIGEGSQFHEEFGYYAQGVGERTAVLPRGWRDRLVRIANPNTRGVAGLCLEVNDLAISKYVAGREKDLDFTREGGIVTYSLSGKQYVAITSGNLSRTMWVGAGLPHIIVYTVGDVASDAAVVATGARLDVERGAGAFIRSCAACHGLGANGGTGPALRGVGKKLSTEELGAQIRSPRATATGAASMPAFAADALPDASLRDVVAYLETL